MNINYKLIINMVNRLPIRRKTRVSTIEEVIKFYRELFKDNNLCEIYIPDDNGNCIYYITVNNSYTFTNFFEFNTGAVNNFTIFSNIKK